MTFLGVIFYLLAAFVVLATVLAITRRELVHAIVYLIISFLGTALLFYLLGAPLLAALEVIIYAGAIMVLFLFIVMTVIVKQEGRAKGGSIRQWLLAVLMAVISFYAAAILIFEVPANRVGLQTSVAKPAIFGRFLFQNYWFPIEIASFLLLIALVGALYLGRQERKTEGSKKDK
jgi:NADH-quinone oxidoreductase subunit J